MLGEGLRAGLAHLGITHRTVLYIEREAVDCVVAGGAMRFGSVCSGIEAASVAWRPLGWKAAWLAEIEPFPSAVLAHHYPEVPNLGDMTKLPEAIMAGDVEAPDVFCGGTPCQAFSVAGLRKSLDDARGNLSLTFCEIANAIDVVRIRAGKPAAVVFWENVPGVLSTADNAFGCFLAGLAGEADPIEPPGKKWSNAGVVVGPQRAVAWRVLDAQYFGVAQRRRRVFVVASSRDGFDPAAVLFEWDSLRRDSAPSREAGEVVTPTIRAGAPNGGAGHGARSGDSKDELIVPVDTFACGGIGSYASASASATLLKSGQDLGPGCETIITMAHGQGGAEIGFDRGPTLTCNHEAPIVASTLLKGGHTNNPLDETLVPCTAHTLRGEGFDASEDGTGRGTPLVPVVDRSYQKPLPGEKSNDYWQRMTDYEREHGIDPNVPIAFDTTQITSPSNYSNPQPGDPCHPLAAGAHVPAIAFHPTQDPISSTDGSTHCMGTGSKQGAATVAVAFGGDIARTLQARHDSSPCADRGMDVVATAMQVRRLTPVECERLQGFPDGYTAIPWRKKPADQCPDGPRYKALGNSWAVPNVRWIGRRIAAHISMIGRDQ